MFAKHRIDDLDISNDIKMRVQSYIQNTGADFGAYSESHGYEFVR